MRNNPVKEKLVAGEKVFGTMVFEFSSPGLPAILAAAGADFILYDMEHSGISMGEMRRQIALARGLNIVPLVRPPAKDYDTTSSLLDMGVMGLMFPMVESREEAEEIVSWCRYPPEGVRGAGFGLAHDDFLGGDVLEKMKTAHQRTIVLPMIETAKGVENADEIMSVPGVDGAHLGQFDLSLSMEVPGQIQHPKVQAGIDALLNACEKHHKFAGCLAPDIELGKEWIRQGFRMISYSYDVGLLQSALSQGIAELKK